MAAVGAFDRPNGERVIVHRCWDCGRVRNNRVAADDNWALVMRLPLIEQTAGAPAADRTA